MTGHRYYWGTLQQLFCFHSSQYSTRWRDISTFAINNDGCFDTFQWSRLGDLLGSFSALKNNLGMSMSYFLFPWIQILEYSYVILSFTFGIEVLHLCRMLARLSRLLTCHNDVIDAGQNNGLFAPGTDMDRALLFIYHICEKGTFYVQICDQLYYMTHWLCIILLCNYMNKDEIMHMTIFFKGIRHAL